MKQIEPVSTKFYLIPSNYTTQTFNKIDKTFIHPNKTFKSTKFSVLKNLIQFNNLILSRTANVQVTSVCLSIRM